MGFKTVVQCFEVISGIAPMCREEDVYVTQQMSLRYDAFVYGDYCKTVTICGKDDVDNRLQFMNDNDSQHCSDDWESYDTIRTGRFTCSTFRRMFSEAGKTQLKKDLKLTLVPLNGNSGHNNACGIRKNRNRLRRRLALAEERGMAGRRRRSD